MSLIALLGAFTAVLLAAFLFSVPSRNKIANALLGGFLVLTAIDISAWFAGGWWSDHPDVATILPAFSALQMPLFTGFIWLSCFTRPRLRPADLLHALPAIVIFGIALTGGPLGWLRIFLELQYIAYIGAAIFLLWRMRRTLAQHFSQPSDSLRLLMALVATSLFAHGFFFLRVTIAPTIAASTLMAMQLGTAILVLGITIALAFKALLSPQLFRGTDKVAMSTAELLREASGRDDDLDRLETFMVERRPYLDPDITLERLARQSGIPARRLSGIVNLRIGAHFFDFVNGYRIAHAKDLLATTDQTVTDIIFLSGFNSKSSFNTAFRKHANMTPSAFRKSNAKGSDT